MTLPDTAAAPPDPTDSLAARVASLERAVAAHLADARGLTRDALRHSHAEIDRLRDEAGLGAIRPLFNELLALHDDLGALVGHYTGAADPVPPEAVAANLGALRAQLGEVLARRGVVRIDPPARRLDRDTQRAVGVIPTADPDQDLIVLEEVRAGFAGPAGVVRRTEVVIHRYTPSAPTGTTT